VLAAGRRRRPEALPELARLAADRLYPAIVRATALSLLAAYPSEDDAGAALQRALTDEEALLRHTAVQHQNERDAKNRLRLLGPLLHDPVRGVRLEAARQLATVPRTAMDEETRTAFDRALAAYRRAMERTADFATSRHNLATLSEALGQPAEAKGHYQAAVTIDRDFWPAKVNLAMLLNREARNEAAAALLQEVVHDHPDRYEIHYSLGLLLAEMQQFESAAVHLAAAAAGLPGRGRIQYNLGLLLQRLNRYPEAETALATALETDPDNGEFQYALALFYLQRHRMDRARALAAKMAQAPRTREAGNRLLQVIESRRGEPTKGNNNE
jgi:tetratricopeptide (TPR) repeat protein